MARMNSTRLRLTCDIRGVVQGVGFRPALFRIATAAGLAGTVQNRTGTVRLVLEGAPDAVKRFLRDLPARLPANARLDDLTVIERRPVSLAEALSSFTILESHGDDHPDIVIPADLALCADCLRELQDPANRRYGYPFTTCTRCGPRYTVIASMPYDRLRTSMSRFPLCPDCEREYRDVNDRRFHCETIACPRCGPRLFLEDRHGRIFTDDVLAKARRALAQGSVVAVRGIGGFLLAAGAFDRPALAGLRRRKNRPHKPFAVMARDPDVVWQVCVRDTAADELLRSPAAPIVLDRRAHV